MRDYCYKTLFFGLYPLKLRIFVIGWALLRLIEGGFANDIFVELLYGICICRKLC